jgi:hypothetical protein
MKFLIVESIVSSTFSTNLHLKSPRRYPEYRIPHEVMLWQKLINDATKIMINYDDDSRCCCGETEYADD